MYLINSCFVKVSPRCVCACAKMKSISAFIKFRLAIIVFVCNQLGYAALESGLNREYSSKVAGQCSITSNNSCPTWFVSSANGTCRCGKRHGIISCDEDRSCAAVLNCYCVSYDPSLNEVVAGACFFNCEPHKKTSVYQWNVHGSSLQYS